jgi:hypothetical protein
MNVRDEINAGKRPGSRIFCAGNILGFDGPFSADFLPRAAEIVSPGLVHRVNAIWVENVGRQLIAVGKVQISSAVRVPWAAIAPSERAAAVAQLASFAEDRYLHQTVVRFDGDDGETLFHEDLPAALATVADPKKLREEWRIHFHIPLHCRPTELFDTTSDQITGVIDLLAQTPSLCSHIEMETYTWEVMPSEIKNRSVVEQLVSEYEWTLAQLRERGLGAMGGKS